MKKTFKIMMKVVKQKKDQKNAELKHIYHNMMNKPH